jgi:streptogramin lyase
MFMGRKFTKTILRSSFFVAFILALVLAFQRVDVAAAATTFEEVLVPDYGLTLQPGDSYEQEVPFAAINGSDGNLWYLLHSTGGAVKAWLVKYNADTGQHTRYQLLTGNGVQNTYLLKGSDGNIWYTGRGSYLVKIEINTQGEPVLTSYPSPGGAQKTSIAVGPNGNFWFQSAIGWFYEVSTTGETLRQCWTNTTNSQGVVFDSSGNLWFANSTGNMIGRLNVNNPTGCDFTQFGHANISSPRSLILGPDGNIWFINTFNNYVGRITPSGVITMALHGTRPSDILLGPDNNIWMLMYNSLGILNTSNLTYSPQSIGVVGMISNNLNQINRGCRQDMYFTYRKNPKIPTYIKDTYAIGRIDLGLYTPPTTSITNVSESNASSGTMVQITAQSGDDTSVTKLELYVDNILVDSIDNPPASHTFNWNTAGYVEGNHTVKTKVYDSPSNCPVASNEVTVFIDNTSPTLSILEPSVDFLTNGAKINFKTASSDNSSVALLEIYVGSTKITSITNPSSVQDFPWSSNPLAEGIYTVKAIAYDQAGNSTEYISPSILKIDKTNPTISISSPTSGSTLTRIVEVSALASDTNGIANVQFKINGSLYGAKDTTPPYSINWDTVLFNNGTYTIGAIATDAAGNISSVEIPVNIRNPRVTICINPGENQQTVTVSISALQTFLNDGAYLGNCREFLRFAPVNFISLTESQELEKISVVRQADNTVLATINEGNDLSEVNLELVEDETLLVNGLLGAVNVKSGATIKGNGKVKALTVNEGAYLAPGSSPGCLTTEELLLEGTYTFELGGLAACTQHDQVIVNGTLTLSGTLEIELEDGYRPELDQSFIIITNDGTDAVVGTFIGLAEGGLTEVAGVTYLVSYVGGDGNDVELTVNAIDENRMSEIIGEETNKTTAGDNQKNTSRVYIVVGLVATIIILVGIILQVVKPTNK